MSKQGPGEDVILTGLKGSCSRPKKLLENVCAAGASPVAGVSYSTFVGFHSLSHRIVLLSLSKPAAAQ